MSFVEKNIEMWNTRMLFEGFCTEGELGFFFFFLREKWPQSFYADMNTHT